MSLYILTKQLWEAEGNWGIVGTWSSEKCITVELYKAYRKAAWRRAATIGSRNMRICVTENSAACLNMRRK